MPSTSKLAHIRIVAFNDVYELVNLPKLQTFLSRLSPPPSAVVLAGDFLSPSPLSSIDGGRGMVATLRAIGLTHCSLGNHEADLSLSSLRSRLTELSKTTTVLNSNLRHPPKEESWLVDSFPAYDLVPSYCGRVNIALMGLISDEQGMFRDDKFKGVPIDRMAEAFDAVQKETVLGSAKADLVVPLTHASMAQDKIFAAHLAKGSSQKHLIIGGHEHEPMDETVVGQNGATVRILKAGTEAQGASLIDLKFDTSGARTEAQPLAKLAEIDYQLIDLRELEDSVVVKQIVDTHMKVLHQMEHQIVVNCSELLPPGEILSSKRTRHEQTTMGAFFCQAIKEELEADVAILNGAPIKGDATYPSNKMSYAELRKELPFPTKMVVVKMSRGELEEAIAYSRKYNEKGCPAQDEDLPRRGYLQVDWNYALDIDFSHEYDKLLHVALPRNLLKGFCQIKPLMAVGERLKRDDCFPGEDDYIPALNLVVRYCSKHRWADVLQ